MVKQTSIKSRPKKRPEKLAKNSQKKETVKEKVVKESKQGGRKSAGKERINWPKSNSPEWEKLDADLSALLRLLYAPAEVRAKTHPNVIHGMCKERFGVKEKSQRNETPRGPSRRQVKCKKLRDYITVLKKSLCRGTS